MGNGISSDGHISDGGIHLNALVRVNAKFYKGFSVIKSAGSES